MIDKEYVNPNKYPEKNKVIAFFKRLFCNHDYPFIKKEDFPNDCYLKVDCKHCGKKKSITIHDYKCITTKQYVEHFYMMGNQQEVIIKKIFECKKCDNVISRRYII